MVACLIAVAFLTGADAACVSGEAELVAEGFMFTEGPVWIDGEGLLFSDIPANAIYRPDKSIFRKPSGMSNGLTLDREGRLIACEHQNRRVSRTEPDGTITVLASEYEGKRLNSPNDVVVRSDGTIFFTDPPYGLAKGLNDPGAELTFAGVYAIAPSGVLTLLVDDFIKPNGLAFSPDEKTLYIADTEGKHIRAFDASADGALSNNRIFAELPSPDGMKMDASGQVWCTAGDGVRVFDASGKLLQTIPFPAQPANCAFGDADGRTLFVTARRSVYKIRVSMPGIRPGNGASDSLKSVGLQ